MLKLILPISLVLFSCTSTPKAPAVRPYTLDTCVVMDSKLGSMGDPVQRVVGNRLVQFCCGGCEPAFAKDPAAHLAKLDAAWAAHGKHKRKAKGESAEHGHGDHGKGGGH